MREEIGSGHIHSVDELIVYAVRAMREKQLAASDVETLVNRRPPEEKKSLARRFAESPSKGLEMKFERFAETWPPVEP
ncbi:MAG: hypothetical protein M3Y07_06430 [Acidobacteriota bacterium]|nr:hypothetical protein [Acidobacteriota bacterium]